MTKKGRGEGERRGRERERHEIERSEHCHKHAEWLVSVSQHCLMYPPPLSSLSPFLLLCRCLPPHLEQPRLEVSVQNHVKAEELVAEAAVALGQD